MEIKKDNGISSGQAILTLLITFLYNYRSRRYYRDGGVIIISNIK